MWVLRETIVGDRVSEFPLEEDVIRIGRDGSNDIVLDGEEVSRVHAEVRPAAEHVTVIDLQSANGVMINERKIAKETPLRANETMRVGNHVLVLLRRTTVKEFQDQTIVDNPDRNLQVRLREVSFPPEPAELSYEATHKIDEKRIGQGLPPSAASERPFLKMVHGTGAYVIAASEFLIGRGVDCDLVIQDDEASRRHAKIVWRKNQHFLYDTESANGTFVGGIKTRGVGLKSGDFIRIGDTLLQYVDPANPPAPNLPAPKSPKSSKSRRTAAVIAATLAAALILAAALYFFILKP